MKSIYILLLTSTLLSYSDIRDYQTARTMSSSGAGVASLNIVDSTSLNPATAAFYKGSLFYAQTKRSALNESPLSSTTPGAPDGFMLGMTDTAAMGNGGLMFQKYSESNIERMRFGFNMAKHMNKTSAVGVSYYYTIDKNALGEKTKKHRANVGYSFLISDNLTFGAVAQDVSNHTDDPSRAIIGAQLSFSKYLGLMLDGGFDYRKSSKKTRFYRVGGQVRFLKDFFFRGGIQNDKIDNVKGHSFGAGWVAPKVTFEIAYQKSKTLNKSLASLTGPQDSLTEMLGSLIFKLK